MSSPKKGNPPSAPPSPEKMKEAKEKLELKKQENEKAAEAGRRSSAEIRDAAKAAANLRKVMKPKGKGKGKGKKGKKGAKANLSALNAVDKKLQRKFTEDMEAEYGPKPIKKKKPTFSQIAKIQPDGKGLNIMLKCVSIKKVEDTREGVDIWEAVVGDETGIVTLQLRNPEHKDVCTPGASLRMQNAKVIMIKGFIRVAIDKWAVLKKADEDLKFEPKKDKDISSVEYELAS